MATVEERWAAYLTALNQHYQSVAAVRRTGGYAQEMPPIAPAIGDRPQNTAKVSYKFPQPASADHYRRALQSVYGWQQQPYTEAQFQQAFVSEALRRGVTKEQAVGVYKFETGGVGTSDFKAFNSSAIGNVQMLNHNTLAKLETYGHTYAAMYESMAQTQLSHRADYLKKAQQLREMQADLKTIPELYKNSPLLPYEIAQGGRRPRNQEELYTWFANLDTQRVPDGHPLAVHRNKGHAMHGLQMTLPLGPMMQAQKLQDINRIWAQEGTRTPLNAAQLEFINLVGEGAAVPILKSMQGDGRVANLPITNFMTRDGYIGNPLVQHRYSRDNPGEVLQGTGAAVVGRIASKIAGIGNPAGAAQIEAMFDADRTRQSPHRRPVATS